MATDAIGQTIPSWVEDNSYELKSMATFTSNEGHVTPCSDADFRALWKTHYDNHSINKMINISSDQVYQSHQFPLFIDGRKRKKVFKQIKQDNHAQKIKDDNLIEDI